jgi:hypothetical protein
LNAFFGNDGGLYNRSKPICFLCFVRSLFFYFNKVIVDKIWNLGDFAKEHRELCLSGNACAKRANPAGWR